MKHKHISPAPRPCGRHLLRRAFTGLLWSVLLLLLGLATAPVRAATFTVINTNDSGPGSLRAAITSANSSAGADTINATGISGTINLASALPSLSRLTLNGPGATQLTVRRDSGGDYRIFTVSQGAIVTLFGLRIANGKASGSSPTFGRGIYNGGTLTVSHCTISGNSTTAGPGGGIYTGGPLTVRHSTFSGNSAAGLGGAIGNTGTLTVSHSTFSGNSADFGGGAIVCGSSQSFITNSTFSGNSAGSQGGAIRNGAHSLLRVSHSTFSGNSAESGGAVFNEEGTLTVNNSTFAGNSTTSFDGGAIFDVSYHDSATLTVSHSTISGNSAKRGGGGIYNVGGFQGRVTLTVSNCTLMGNSADGGQGGGIVNNRQIPDVIANIGSTIIAGNSAATSGPDVFGTFNSDGYNLISKRDGSTGIDQSTDQSGTSATPLDPRLGPLQNNGGVTLTHGLLSGSPALDQGQRFGSPLPTTDQRGLPRPVDDPRIANASGGDGSDIGAFEVQPGGSLQFGSATYSVNEGAGTATISVTRTGGSVGAVSVQYATSNGTATAPADYSAKSGTLSWAAGDTTSKSFTVPIVNDAVDEANETVNLTLSNPAGSAALGSPNTATLTILDNDVPPGATAPHTVSLTPNSGSSAPGTTRLFTAVYSDANGVGNIERAYLRIGGSNVNVLLGYYHPGRNKLYLLNDAGTAFLGGFVPGSNNLISNRQGTLNCANTTISTSGNSLTVCWSFTPSGAWSGTTQGLDLYVADVDGLFDGYDPMGTWTISGSVAPANMSLSPASGSSALGNPRLFTAVCSDGDGASNIERAYLRIGSSNSNALLGYYHLGRNGLYLMNDDHTAFIGGFAPGSPNVISNSQGSLNCAGTTVTQEGNTLTVRWSFTPAGTWAGTTQILYLHVEDQGGLNDGYDLMGTWTITSG